MLEIEALAVIKDQTASDHGFIARLQRGEGIDERGVQQLYEALDYLRIHWATTSCLPKTVILPLVDIVTAVRASSSTNPGLEVDIEELAEDLVGHIDEIFLTPLSLMTEERAMSVVYAHLIGLPSLAIDLHHHQIPNADSLDELRAALVTLAHTWSGRDCVPKSIVGPMLNVRQFIREHATLYPSMRTHLEAYADELSDLVRQCLS